MYGMQPMQKPCLRYGRGVRVSVRLSVTLCCPIKIMQARITKSSLLAPQKTSVRTCKAFLEIQFPYFPPFPGCFPRMGLSGYPEGV